MAQTVCVILNAETRARLEAIIGDRNRALKHVCRTRIILFSADRLPVLEVARRARSSRPAVWRWQLRFAEAGIEGLLRDKTHKHPKVMAWLARHPRWSFHFTPTSGSWLNAVEGFFSKLTRRRLKRGVFRSIADLQAAINRYISENNNDPKPFRWTKSADTILAKLAHAVPSV
jgi:hypothetical protein